MYKIGDLILYGNSGVCQIKDIKTMDFLQNGNGQLYYVLEPLYQSCVIHTPVQNDKIFMRPIISKAEAERLIDMIPAIEAEEVHSRVHRELIEHYETSLNSHNCSDLLELTMSIYAKKQTLALQNKKMGTVDGQYMKLAEELLFGELAAALDIPKEQVPKYIQDRMESLTYKVNS